MYGQTGSGKTYTMVGDEDGFLAGKQGVVEGAGVVPRVARLLFEKIDRADPGSEFTVKVSFLEIYRETIRDLLDPRNSNMRVRESATEGVYVEDLTSEYAAGASDILELLAIGTKNRATGSTAMNAASSRSHSVFQIALTQKLRDGSVVSGKLYLADLAGSEKVAKTGAAGETLDEAKAINQSLSALGMVINALTQPSRLHVPYRDSKLTFILREALGGNAKTTLLVTCSPHEANKEETYSTLKFAQRAKNVKLHAKINVQLSVEELNAMVQFLQRDLASLRRRCAAAEAELEWARGAGTGPVPEAILAKHMKALGAVPSSKGAAGEQSGPKHGQEQGLLAPEPELMPPEEAVQEHPGLVEVIREEGHAEVAEVAAAAAAASSSAAAAVAATVAAAVAERAASPSPTPVPDPSMRIAELEVKIAKLKRRHDKEMTILVERLTEKATAEIRHEQQVTEANERCEAAMAERDRRGAELVRVADDAAEAARRHRYDIEQSSLMMANQARLIDTLRGSVAGLEDQLAAVLQGLKAGPGASERSDFALATELEDAQRVARSSALAVKEQAIELESTKMQFHLAMGRVRELEHSAAERVNHIDRLDQQIRALTEANAQLTAQNERARAMSVDHYYDDEPPKRPPNTAAASATPASSRVVIPVKSGLSLLSPHRGKGPALSRALPQHTVFSREGNLLRQGTILRTWKKRYCALQNHMLYVFENRKDEAAQVVLNVTEFLDVKPLPDTAKNWKPNSFVLSTGSDKTTQIFSAESADDCAGWIAALSGLVRSAQEPQAFYVELCENSRRVDSAGAFSPENLRPAERGAFSTADGSISVPSLEDFAPPQGGVWGTEWQRVITSETCPDGWKYSFDWGSLWTPQRSVTDRVAKRTWKRLVLLAKKLI